MLAWNRIKKKTGVKKLYFLCKFENFLKKKNIFPQKKKMKWKTLIWYFLLISVDFFCWKIWLEVPSQIRYRQKWYLAINFLRAYQNALHILSECINISFELWTTVEWSIVKSMLWAKNKTDIVQSALKLGLLMWRQSKTKALIRRNGYKQCFLLVRTAETWRQIRKWPKNKSWNDTTSLSIDYVWTTFVRSVPPNPNHDLNAF